MEECSTALFLFSFLFPPPLDSCHLNYHLRILVFFFFSSLRIARRRSTIDRTVVQVFFLLFCFRMPRLNQALFEAPSASSFPLLFLFLPASAQNEVGIGGGGHDFLLSPPLLPPFLLSKPHFGGKINMMEEKDRLSPFFSSSPRKSEWSRWKVKRFSFLSPPFPILSGGERSENFRTEMMEIPPSPFPQSSKGIPNRKLKAFFPLLFPPFSLYFRADRKGRKVNVQGFSPFRVATAQAAVVW